MGRTIIIGDVHGCRRELSELLDRLAYSRTDELYLVGDLVNKGPDSRGVLKLARSLGAGVVLGNHEHRLIAARGARRENKPGPRLGPTQERLLQEFDAEDWAQIEGFPLKIDVPRHGVRIVHAGVVPGVPFEELDMATVTRMRSIDAEGKPSDKWGVLWGTLYEGPPHVVFGHNARREPQLHRAATGLDTGCVYGGALTALVLEGSSLPPPPAERGDVLRSVRAAQVYEDYGRELP